MRIISGKYKGRTIKMPRGIRPTQDKVRKALFDILGDIEGLSFLDLFAGSGAVGLEALSRGAKQVVFVEEERKCVNIIKDNFRMLDTGYSMPDKKPGSRIEDRVSLLSMDAASGVKFLTKNKERFDIIFLDPPYHEGLSKKTLQMLEAYDILAPNGFIVAQRFKKESLPDNLGVLILFREARYGDTVLAFYRKVESSE